MRYDTYGHEEAETRAPYAIYQWANEKGIHGMATPAHLESLGFVKVRQRPNYPLSWLMRKEAT